MKRGTRLLLSLSLCAVVTTLAATFTTQFPYAAGRATIQTDLADYPPNSQVNVTGAGWMASEVVELTFTETATTPPGGALDSPVTFYANANDQGTIANGEFHTDQHDVGVHFLLTAKGTISGRTAQATFTDGLATLFQIDGDANGSTSDSHDWDQVYADHQSILSHAAGTGAIQFTVDKVNSDLDDTFSNSAKDTQDITGWKWGLKTVSNKTDLEHGFAAAYQDATTGHTLLYVGTDRFASGSSSAISIWFLQHPIGKGTGGTFENKANHTPEVHSVGDLLIQASLGSTATVTAYTWDPVYNIVTNPLPPLKPITLTLAQEIAAINTAAVSVPWTFSDATGKSSPQAQEFFEVGLDLNAIFASGGIGTVPDFSSFIITTRTSTAQTATLSDFILGDVSTVPDVAVVKTADSATVAPGDRLRFTVAGN